MEMIRLLASLYKKMAKYWHQDMLVLLMETQTLVLRAIGQMEL